MCEVRKILCHSREGGNSSSHCLNARKNTPSFPRRRESIVPLPQRPKKYSVIPAKAGIHNSRACGNLTETENGNTVQTDQYTLFPRKTTTSFPRRTTTSFPHGRESTPSVILAKAGIHRPTASTLEKILRHSREGGNPQFPRRREFNENGKREHRPD